MLELTPTNKTYRKSIEIIMELYQNDSAELAFDMCTELAKMDPDTLVACYELVKGEVDTAVIQALNENKKIEAIKIYRRYNGGNFKEAKEYVDALQERINA